MANRGFDGEVQGAESVRRAGTEGGNVFLVGQAVASDRKRRGGAENCDGLRRLAMEAHQIQPVVGLIGLHAQLQTALTAIPGLLVRQPRTRRLGGQQQLLGAVSHDVYKGKVAADGRYPVLLPPELVERPDRQRRSQLDAARHLRHRPDRLLELRVRHRDQLDHVDRAHRPGDGVATEEQALAPQQRMAAQTHAGALVADLELAEHEGIQEFGLAAVKPSRGVGELVVRDRGLVRERPTGEARVVVLAVVDAVIPGRAAQPHAVSLRVDRVDLGQQVDAIRNHSLAKVAVAVIGVRIPEQGRVSTLHAPCGAVLEGVVEVDRKVSIAGVDRHRTRSHRRAERQHHTGANERPRWTRL